MASLKVRGQICFYKERIRIYDFDCWSRSTRVSREITSPENALKSSPSEKMFSLEPIMLMLIRPLFLFIFHHAQWDFLGSGQLADRCHRIAGIPRLVS